MKPDTMVTPFAQITIDIKQVLISQSDYHYIIVAMDYVTKYVEARALRTRTPVEIASFLYEEIISRHGTPKIIFTDKEQPSIAEYLKLICKQFNIKIKGISPFHSPSNGVVDRFDRTLETILKKKSLDQKKNWKNFLPAVLFAYRSIKQTTTGQSPLFLMYGYESDIYFDNEIEPMNTDETSFDLLLFIRAREQLEYLENVERESWSLIPNVNNMLD